MIFFNSFFFKKTKSFLKMHNAKVVSQALVLVNTVYKGLIPQQSTDQLIQVHSPFESIANILLLKTIMNGIDGFKIPQPSQLPQLTQQFIFGDFTFTHAIFPPKFVIKHVTSEEKTDKIKEVAQKIISLANLNDSLGAIGFNYEMLINNENNQIPLKEKVCNPSITGEFDQVNITLTYTEGEMTLNLKIADAIANGKKSILIDANFHNNVTPANRFENIMEKDFRGIIDQKLSTIFPSRVCQLLEE